MPSYACARMCAGESLAFHIRQTPEGRFALKLVHVRVFACVCKLCMCVFMRLLAYQIHQTQEGRFALK